MKGKSPAIFWIAISIAAWVFVAVASAAEEKKPAPELPFIHPIYDSLMVLPRDVENPVWGWAKPDELVSVEVKDNGGRSLQRKSAKAAADGRWEILIGPFQATDKPLSLTFTRASLLDSCQADTP